MLEIAPRITYSPEGILELHRTVGEDAGAIYAQHKEIVDAIPGYEVVDDGPDTTVRVEVHKVVKINTQSDWIDSSAGRLIENLSFFTHFSYKDLRDGVISLYSWTTDWAPSGFIYPQLQRWLNAGGLDEDTARNCINAMAYPLGFDAQKQAKKDFSYRINEKSAGAGAGGFTFGVISKRDTFGVAEEFKTGEEYSHRVGEVEWNWINLSTIGSCACWAADWEQRKEVHISSDLNRLYKISPHNVDSAVQSLSLVLGAATLAYEAARYPGTEDILSNAKWRPPRN